MATSQALLADGEPNGLGNVVIGYNQERIDDGNPNSDDTNVRTGSHMLVSDTNCAPVVSSRQCSWSLVPSPAGQPGDRAR